MVRQVVNIKGAATLLIGEYLNKVEVRFDKLKLRFYLHTAPAIFFAAGRY
jgi:hypothetical protein